MQKADGESRDDHCDMANAGRYRIRLYWLVGTTANCVASQPLTSD